MKDIRISTTFPNHRKTRRLYKKLGAEGVKSLVYLWLYACEHRSDGLLTGMTNDDIATEAQWPGDPNEFVNTLLSPTIKFLISVKDVIKLHDWEIWNPWAATAKYRSEIGRLKANKRWTKQRIEVRKSLKELKEMDELTKNVDANLDIGIAEIENGNAGNGNGNAEKKALKHAMNGAINVHESASSGQKNLTSADAPYPLPSPSPSPSPNPFPCPLAFAVIFDQESKSLLLSEQTNHHLDALFPDLDLKAELLRLEKEIGQAPEYGKDYLPLIVEILREKAGSV